MGISDRILGKKDAKGSPHIQTIWPAAALPGGDVRIAGEHLRPNGLSLPRVTFADSNAHIVVSADEFVIARVPEEAHSGEVVISINGSSSNAMQMRVGALIAEQVHAVTNPAIDQAGNIYTTLSGQRGQKSPVSVYKMDPEYNIRPFVTSIMNASGIAVDREGALFVSSRHEGTVYKVTPDGELSMYAEGLGVATGIAFDREGSLYVGDRSGTIFKIDRKREMFVFATLEPSVSAYHLAFAPNGDLYVSGPTTSSFDAVYRVTPQGEVSEFFRGFGRPQGMAFDSAGNLYVAASYSGRKGIVRVSPQGEASLAIAGNNIVGLCFAPEDAVVIATNTELYFLSWGIEGLPLHG